jgi:AraC-like DNA-binding protein
MDPLNNLLSHCNLRTDVFHTGELCGVADFDGEHQAGHFHLLREGRVIVHHSDRPAIEINVPTLLFYPRAINHRLVVPTDTKADIVCANVVFEDSHCNPLARALPDHLLFPLEQLPSLQRLLTLLFDEAFCDSCGRQFVLDRLCDVLVVQVIRHALERGVMNAEILGALSDSGLSRVLAAIHAEPAQVWTLEEMAKIAGMSRTSFAMRFHQAIGVTPADYLTGWRISLAQKLIGRKISVQKVAMDVGYGSQAAFTKAFKARLGMSPRAWMKRNETLSP